MADKWQALCDFWNSFGLVAYDEFSVPDDASMPYITYSSSTSNFETPLFLSASLWYRSSSWADISHKADEIARRVRDYTIIKIDGGYMHITRGSPFTNRMNDPNDDMIKRVYINVVVEFFTND